MGARDVQNVRSVQNVQKVITNAIDPWEIFLENQHKNFPQLYGICGHFLDTAGRPIVQHLATDTIESSESVCPQV